MLRLAVIGYGYWGPRIVRNFHSVEGCKVVAVCDRSTTALQRAARDFPGVELTNDFKAILESTDIDAIAIVTPVWTHFDLAESALRNGKHVFVEKPFTSTAAQAEKLVELADRKNLQIMVDHTFLFTGAVRRIRKMVEEGTLGKLYYYDATRVNLGLFQHDVNVIWDLAPHDLSILDHLATNEPQYVTATGQSHLNGLEDLAYITVYYSDQMIAHFNVNWLSPVKVRTTLIGGEKQMLVWNDLEADEKLKVYDKGVSMKNGTNGQNIYELLVSYRSGDMWSPRVEQTEALAVEAKYFIDCISNGEKPFNDGRAGLRIVRLLEAADKSLKARGVPVQL
jgi:predicted dehydrogenase